MIVLSHGYERYEGVESGMSRIWYTHSIGEVFCSFIPNGQFLCQKIIFSLFGQSESMTIMFTIPKKYIDNNTL